jgi:membrane protein DedA with SNARE-associated domain
MIPQEPPIAAVADSMSEPTPAKRYILPLIGLTIALTAYVLQNVWGVINVASVAQFVRSLGTTGMLLGICALAAIEGTVILCLYFPGTAILIVLLLALHMTGGEAIQVLLALNIGTIIGYIASWLIGRSLQSQLPRFMGEAYVNKINALVRRYGLASLLILSSHPNNLALAFAILGVASTVTALKYFVVAVAVQNVWWLGFAYVADLFSTQQFITQTNFYLYLAAAFGAWLTYELVNRRRVT